MIIFHVTIQFKVFTFESKSKFLRSTQWSFLGLIKRVYFFFYSNGTKGEFYKAILP